MALMADELDILDLKDIDLNQAFRSYLAHKRWVIRHLRTNDQLLDLLKDNFTGPTLENLRIVLTKCEQQIAYLSQYSDMFSQ